MTTDLQRVLEHIDANPGSLTRDISAALSIKNSTVAVHTKMLHDRGLVTRESVKGRQGPPAFRYTVVDKTEQPSVSYPVSPATVCGPITRQPEPAPELHKPLSEPSPTSIELLLEQWAEGMANALADQIVEGVKAKLGAKLESRLPTVVPTVLPTAVPKLIKPAVTVSKAKVVIVGLLPAQAGMIQQEFHECFDITFCEADHVGSRLRGLLGHVEHVVSMTKFVSHDTQELIKLHHGTINYHRIHGGMSQLRDLLTNLYIGVEVAG